MTQEEIDALLMEARAALVPDPRTTAFEVHATLRDGALVLAGDVHDRSLKERLLAHMKERTGLPLVDELTGLPHPDLGEHHFGIVSLSVANLRRRPGHAEELVSQALLGTPMRLLKQNGDWVWVQTPDDYLGWVIDRIGRTDGPGLEAWVRRLKLVVTAPFTWIRTAPDALSEPVSDAVAGGILALTGERGGFHAVEYPDGRTGYLASADAEPYAAWLARVAATPESIVATAHQFLGLPYLWGGTSAKALDCSGFTKTVYFLNGVLLPRDASQQWLVGEGLDRSARLQGVLPGDLLFFGARASDSRSVRVTHVAISLGGGRFIHAPGNAGTAGIRINSLFPQDPAFDEQRAADFLGARRVIGCGPDKGVYHLRENPWYAAPCDRPPQSHPRRR